VTCFSCLLHVTDIQSLTSIKNWEELGGAPTAYLIGYLLFISGGNLTLIESERATS
jgi:hypothetical protein